MANNTLAMKKQLDRIQSKRNQIVCKLTTAEMDQIDKEAVEMLVENLVKTGLFSDEEIQVKAAEFVKRFDWI